MNDFQSFLFQNMQMIGLQDCEEPAKLSEPVNNNNQINESISLKSSSNNLNKLITNTKKLNTSSTTTCSSTLTTNTTHTTNTVSSSIENTSFVTLTNLNSKNNLNNNSDKCRSNSNSNVSDYKTVTNQQLSEKKTRTESIKNTKLGSFENPIQNSLLTITETSSHKQSFKKQPDVPIVSKNSAKQQDEYYESNNAIYIPSPVRCLPKVRTHDIERPKDDEDEYIASPRLSSPKRHTSHQRVKNNNELTDELSSKDASPQPEDGELNQSFESDKSKRISSFKIKTSRFSISANENVKFGRNSSSNFKLDEYKNNYNEFSFRRRTTTQRDIMSSPESLSRKLEFKSSTPIISSCYHVDSKCDHLNINENYEREIKSPIPIKLNHKRRRNNKRASYNMFDFSKDASLIEASTNSIEDEDNQSITDSNYQVKSTVFNKKKVDKHVNLEIEEFASNCSSTDSDISADDDFDKLSVNLKNFKSSSHNIIVDSKRTNDKNKKISTIKRNKREKEKEKNKLSLNGTNSVQSFESVMIEPILEKFEEEVIKSSKTEIIKDLSNYNKFSLKKYLKDINSFRLKRGDNNKTTDKIEDKSNNVEHLNISKTSKVSADDIVKNTRKEIPWDNLEVSSMNLLIKSVEKANADQQVVPELYTKNGHKIKSSQIKKWMKILIDFKVNSQDSTTTSEMQKSILNSESQKSIKLFKKEYLMNKKRQILDKVSKKTSKTFSEISNSCSELSRKSSKLYSNIITDGHKNNAKKSPNLTSSKSNIKIDCDEIDLDDDLKQDEVEDQISIHEERVINRTPRKNFKISDLNTKINRRKDSVKSSSEEDDKEDVELEKEETIESESLIVNQINYMNEEFNFESGQPKLTKITSNKSSEKQRHQPSSTSKTKNSNSSMIHDDHFYNEIHETSFEQKQKKIKQEMNKVNRKDDIMVRPSKPNDSRPINKPKINSVEHEKNERNGREKQPSMPTRMPRSKPDLLDRSNENHHNQSNSSKLAKSDSSTSLVPPLPEFSELVCKSSNLNDSFSKATGLKQTCSLAKLKSPERKILYNEWFTIIKKMEKDPKFDLETLVRTRGRFTEHDRISYRDRLMIKQQKLRCARSEPNFGAMLYLSQNLENNNGNNDDTSSLSKNKDGQTNRTMRESPMRSRDKRYQLKSGGNDQVKLKRNLSATLHDTTDNNRDITVNSECISDRYNHHLHTRKNDKSTTKEKTTTSNKLLASANDQSNNSLSSAVKLTLQKSDINLIKEILKKKEKSVISDLTNFVGTKLSNKSNPINQNSSFDSRKLNTSNNNKKSEEQTNKSNGNSSNMNRKGVFKNYLETLNNSSSNLKTRSNSNDRSLDITNQLNDTENNHTSRQKMNRSENAKHLCDEFSKMVKGTIGTTLKNLAHNSKTATSSNNKGEFELVDDNKNRGRRGHRSSHSNDHDPNIKRRLNAKDEKKLKKSSTTFSSMSLNSDESIAENLNEDDDDRKNAFAKSSSQQKQSNPKKHPRPPPPIIRSMENISSINRDEPRNAKKNGQEKRPKIPKSPSPPPRPAPPKRPPPPRPMSPGNSITQSCHNLDPNKSLISYTSKHTKPSNLPPRPPLPPAGKVKRPGDQITARRDEFASESIIYEQQDDYIDKKESSRNNRSNHKESSNGKHGKANSKSTSYSSSTSRSNSSSPSIQASSSNLNWNNRKVASNQKVNKR